MAEQAAEVDTEVEVHWGCQFVLADGGVYLTRWNPGYGTGTYRPYTEAEARADVARPERDGIAKRLVRRTETTVTTTTSWEEVKV